MTKMKTLIDQLLLHILMYIGNVQCVLDDLSENKIITRVTLQFAFVFFVNKRIPKMKAYVRKCFTAASNSTFNEADIQQYYLKHDFKWDATSSIPFTLILLPFRRTGTSKFFNITKVCVFGLEAVNG